MAFVKIENEELIRDTNNMALLNYNANELESYYKKREILLGQKSEINNIKSEISELKNDIGEIKNLLNLLVKDKN